MFDLLLTDEQKMLTEMVHDFAINEIEPVASENERNHRYPVDVIKKAGELGLMGIAYPEEYGGSGMDYTSYMLAIEEVSRYCASTGVIISAHSSLACDPIFRFGTEEQKRKYLPDMLSGNKIGAFSLTESGAGSDAGATKTTAKLVGDKWILNGSKIFATNGAEADVFVLLASTEPEKKTRGVTGFIVDADTPGYSIGKVEKKLGIRSSSTTEIILDNVELPKSAMLGNYNEGFKMQWMNVLENISQNMVVNATKSF